MADTSQVWTSKTIANATLANLLTSVNTYLDTILTPGTYVLANITWGKDSTLTSGFYCNILTVGVANPQPTMNDGNPYRVQTVQGASVDAYDTAVNGLIGGSFGATDTILFNDLLDDGTNLHFIVVTAPLLSIIK